MNRGFIKVVGANVDARSGAVKQNALSIMDAISEAYSKHADIVVFPQNALVGASKGDFLTHLPFLESVEGAVASIARYTKERDCVVVLGCPINVNDTVLKACLVLAKGKLLGVVARELNGIKCGEIFVAGCVSTLSDSLVFREKDYSFAVVCGEDCLGEALKLQESGVHLVINISSALANLNSMTQKITLAKTLDKCAFVYAAASEDIEGAVGSGVLLISECGEILAAAEGGEKGEVVAQIDLDFVRNSNLKRIIGRDPNLVEVAVEFKGGGALERQFSRLPFVPHNKVKFELAMDIAARSLAKRLKHIGLNKVVFGLSGGLDSSFAAIICHHAFNKYGIDTKNIIAVTMPSRFSGERTGGNALKLIEKLNLTHKNICIEDVFGKILEGLCHNGVQDIAFENAQARARTQFLLNLANMEDALLVSTGDMSEIALGFSTFGGDQIGMYNVNAGFTKTFMRAHFDWLGNKVGGELGKILLDIVATPISPELKDGQRTEDIIGSYELNDFLLYHIVFRGADIKKAAFLAAQTFDLGKDETMDAARNFVKRLTRNTFKRNASPDGTSISQHDLKFFSLPSCFDKLEE